MRDTCVMNGRVVSPDRAMVAVDDWGFRYGWGAFETIRVHEGCALFLERHLSRLFRAAAVLHLADANDKSLGLWRRDVQKAIAHSGAREAFLNLYWAGRRSSPKRAPARIVRVRKTKAYPRRALRLWVAPWRIEPTYPGVAAKTLAYFPYIFAGMAAREAGFDEALLLNTSNRVADCGASSVFVIQNGRIITPSLHEGTLAGITRGVVLDLAKRHKIRARQGPVRWSDLTQADGIFVTSALRGVVAVDRIADVWAGQTSRHPAFRSLQDAYRQEVAGEVARWQANPSRC